jgi:RNA polymerase-binding transcription factor DksA
MTDNQARRDHDADAALLQQVRSDLDEVDNALRRLDDGRYGRCRECGDVIDDEVLAAAPAARYCPAHGPDGTGGGGAPAIQG